MAEEGEDFIVTEAFAVRDLVEDEVYQPSASSSPLPTPSSSTLSIAEKNQAFLDSLSDPLNKRGNSEEEDCGSYIEDLNIFDRELVLMSTKDLNSLMKCRNVPKARQAQIKKRRRTLKNRGYAANCRVRRDDEEEVLLEQIEEHERRLPELDEELLCKRRELREEVRRRRREEQEDREWEAAIEECKDLIRPGELEARGLLKVPGQE